MGKKEIKFGSKVYAGLAKGVVVRVTKKRKWTYCDIVFEDAGFYNRGYSDTVEYETYREDRLLK